jgi:hypothetical protein
MASQRVSSSMLTSLVGTQSAARKQRPPDLDAGAWKGSVVHASNNKVAALDAREKWIKLQAVLLCLEEERKKPEGIDHKLLEATKAEFSSSESDRAAVQRT